MTRHFFPHRLTLGELALAGAALLLVQGLVRDAVRVAVQSSRGETRRVRCTCVESALGMAGVAAGGIMLLGGLDVACRLPPFFWPAFFLVVLTLGFFVRELIFDFDQMRIRREPNHRSVSLW